MFLFACHHASLSRGSRVGWGRACPSESNCGVTIPSRTFYSCLSLSLSLSLLLPSFPVSLSLSPLSLSTLSTQTSIPSSSFQQKHVTVLFLLASREGYGTSRGQAEQESGPHLNWEVVPKGWLCKKKYLYLLERIGLCKRACCCWWVNMSFPTGF